MNRFTLQNHYCSPRNSSFPPPEEKVNHNEGPTSAGKRITIPPQKNMGEEISIPQEYIPLDPIYESRKTNSRALDIEELKRQPKQYEKNGQRIQSFCNYFRKRK